MNKTEARAFHTLLIALGRKKGEFRVSEEDITSSLEYLTRRMGCILLTVDETFRQQEILQRLINL